MRARRETTASSWQPHLRLNYEPSVKALASHATVCVMPS